MWCVQLKSSRTAPEGFLARVEEVGRYLSDRLEALSQRHGCGEVRGRGLLLALDLGRAIGPDVVARAFEAGLLVNAPRPDTLRFMPALKVTREEIDRMIEMLDRVLEGMPITGG